MNTPIRKDLLAIAGNLLDTDVLAEFNELGDSITIRYAETRVSEVELTRDELLSMIEEAGPNWLSDDIGGVPELVANALTGTGGWEWLTKDFDTVDETLEVS